LTFIRRAKEQLAALAPVVGGRTRDSLDSPPGAMLAKNESSPYAQ
jgi:hypothetical protein